MSHYAVATMKKMKVDNLSGMLRHDFRETDHHKNKDIDPRKSYQNIELVASHKLTKQDIMRYVRQQRNSSRKVRKDAVIVDEWIISSDKAFFQDMSREQVKKYFETAVDYFGQQFGRQNIMYGSVHLDETTPHMHMGIVPMTKEHKLSSKQVFNRNKLREVQSYFPKYMQKHGFEVVRGSEKSQRKKLTVDEYKHVQDDIKSLDKRELKLKREALHAIVGIVPDVRGEDSHGKSVKLSEDPGLVEKFVHDLRLDYLLEQLVNLIKRAREKYQALKQREKDLADREKTVAAKEKAFDEFEKKLDIPSPVVDQRFYMSYVQQGVIEPAEKLAKQLGHNSNKLSDSHLKAHEKGRER